MAAEERDGASEQDLRTVAESDGNGRGAVETGIGLSRPTRDLRITSTQLSQPNIISTDSIN